MNASVIYKSSVANAVLDELAQKLPVIISEALEVPGGKLAILKPEQVSLEFSQASTRDAGSEIKIMVFARSLVPRLAKEKDLAKEVLEKVVALVAGFDEDYSVDTRLYFMEVGASEYVPGSAK